jgi:hypothetical protein
MGRWDGTCVLVVVLAIAYWKASLGQESLMVRGIFGRRSLR